MRRTEIDSGGTVGVLWEPDHGEPDHEAERFVVVLGGSGGGFPEDLAHRLAEHGLSAFGLAYFAAPGLPAKLLEIPVESVRQGVELCRERFGGGREVAVLGVSKGAELALLLASHVAGVGPVVAVAPSSVAWYGLDLSEPSSMTRPSWTWHGAPVPFLALRPGVIPAFTDLGVRTDRCYDCSAYATRDVDAASIPVEEANGPLLLLSGDDDHMWPSASMAKAIVDRMRDHGRGADVTSVVYPGAGHAFLMREFRPADGQSTGAPAFDFGGDPGADSAAADDAWRQVLSFLHASPA